MILYPVFATAIGLRPCARRHFHRRHDSRCRPGRRRRLYDLAGNRRHRHLCQAAARRDAVADGLAITFGLAERARSAPAPSRLLPAFSSRSRCSCWSTASASSPHVLADLANDVSRWCLVTAIAALGMKTSFKASVRGRLAPDRADAGRNRLDRRPRLRRGQVRHLIRAGRAGGFTVAQARLAWRRTALRRGKYWASSLMFGGCDA